MEVLDQENKRIAYFISQQDDIDKIYLYAKYLSESNYKFLIGQHEDVRTKCYNDPNAFIECSNTTDGVYKNINEYNSNSKTDF